MEKPTVGTPYLSGGTYAVVITWTAPGQTGSSAIESYEINQAYYSETKTWTVSGTTLSTTADSLIGSRHYAFRVRAINEDGRKGPWSDILPVPIPSVPVTTTTTTLPPPTTTFQIVTTPPTTTTTASAVPRYELYEYKGDNLRWDPCAGPVSIKLNPMGHLTSSQIDEWSTLLRGFAAEISSMTGLNVVYGGQTGTDFRLSHPSGRTSADILIGFGPVGTGHFADNDDPYNTNVFAASQRYISYNQSPGWWTITAADIHVATNSNNALENVAPKGHRTNYLMNHLGNSFGLGDLDPGPNSEVMTWGGDGNGTWNNPDWGEGDKISFGLVGAGNGCLN
jgi:hypothetical protein